MKPYRGIVQIECTVTGDCPRGVRKNVRAECTACPEAVTRIIDLEGKVLHERIGGKAEGKKTEVKTVKKTEGRKAEVKRAEGKK